MAWNKFEANLKQPQQQFPDNCKSLGNFQTNNRLRTNHVSWKCTEKTC